MASPSETITRAYSTITVKSFDVTGRSFSGWATTPQTDRVGDVVEPLGGQFENPMSMMLFHDSKEPVGLMYWGKPTKDGIPFRAEIPEVTEEGDVKRLTDKAAHFVKYRLIRAVSIGFRAIEHEIIKTGIRFTKWEGLETSLVAIPANAGAVINGSTIKSYDTVASLDSPYLAATGENSEQNMAAAVAVPRVVKLTPPKATAMTKTVQEQKASFEATRQAKSARMTEIMQTAADAGVTLDEKQSEEYDALETEVKSIDAHLVRLDALEKANVAKAVPVQSATPAEAAAARSGNPVITFNENVPKGIGFARVAKARMVSFLDHRNVHDVAKEMYPSDQRLHTHLKASVPAGTTTQTDWAAALVDPTNLAGEFIEYLRPATIIGKLNLRRVPFNVRMIQQTGGGTGYWVGQGAPKPLTSFSFAAVTLGITKVAAISVITEELARLSTPSAEMLVRDALRDALVERIDRDFIDPAEAGTANVQPASITNGLTALTSAGTSADNARTDIANIMADFVAANQNTDGIAIIMPTALALALSFQVNSLGQLQFPGLTMAGGTIMGIPVITSQYAANASGGGNLVIALNQREIFLADDGVVTVDASREASLQMLDNPTNNSATATPTTMVSMFQTNSIALRAERFINWSKRRPEAVVYMDDVNWGSIGSPA